MKLILIVCAVACLTLTTATFVDEDFTLVEEQTSSPVDGGEFTEVFMAEELTTKKARMTTTTTSSPKIVAAVDEVEITPDPTTKTRKTSGRPRTSGSRRKQQPAKAKTVDAVPQEEESSKTEMTSPASVDTASVSILAPKNFKPTPKPLEEFQQSQGLMEFLKKRKIERIQASTTEDPFVAILATATMPSTEEPVSPAGESTPVRSSGGSARRLPTTNRRFSASARATTAATTTTTTPATEAPTVAAVTTKRPNRFGALRNSKALGTTATTTAQPLTEESKVTESTRSKLFPKRPVNLRPIGNSISRRKDQATTASPTTPAAEVVEEDVIIPIPEEIEVIVEPTTATPLRRTRGRIAPRVSGI